MAANGAGIQELRILANWAQEMLKVEFKAVGGGFRFRLQSASQPGSQKYVKQRPKAPQKNPKDHYIFVHILGVHIIRDCKSVGSMDSCADGGVSKNRGP